MAELCCRCLCRFAEDEEDAVTERAEGDAGGSLARTALVFFAHELGLRFLVADRTDADEDRSRPEHRVEGAIRNAVLWAYVVDAECPFESECERGGAQVSHALA